MSTHEQMYRRTNGRVEDGYDPATQPKRPEMSLGELVGEMTREVGDLFRKEVELAKVEGREEIRRAGAAGAAFGVAAVGALLALAMLSTALAWWLTEAMHRAVAFAIVGGVWLVVALIGLSVARNRARQIQALPETTQTLKEDVRWARAQTS